jgi:hypothetical protein
LQGFVGEHHRERLAHLIEATLAWHHQKGTVRQEPFPASTIPPEATRHRCAIPAKSSSTRHRRGSSSLIPRITAW